MTKLVQIKIQKSCIIKTGSKAMRSPRFVHFDECLSFVSSDCATQTSKDLVDAANDVYEIFHGAPHPDIVSTDSKRVTKRKNR